MFQNNLQRAVFSSGSTCGASRSGPAPGCAPSTHAGVQDYVQRGIGWAGTRERRQQDVYYRLHCVTSPFHERPARGKGWISCSSSHSEQAPTLMVRGHVHSHEKSQQSPHRRPFLHSGAPAVVCLVLAQDVAGEGHGHAGPVSVVQLTATNVLRSFSLSKGINKLIVFRAEMRTRPL